MSFEDFNNEVKARSGGWVNLKEKGDSVEGKVIAPPEVRDQTFKGTVLTVQADGPNKGKVRKEWVFTLEGADGEVVKVSFKESGQRAITAALNGRKLQQFGTLKAEIVEKESGKQAEYKATYTDPVIEYPLDSGSDDEPPY